MVIRKKEGWGSSISPADKEGSKCWKKRALSSLPMLQKIKGLKPSFTRVIHCRQSLCEMQYSFTLVKQPFLISLLALPLACAQGTSLWMFSKSAGVRSVSSHGTMNPSMSKRDNPACRFCFKYLDNGDWLQSFFAVLAWKFFNLKQKKNNDEYYLPFETSSVV